MTTKITPSLTIVLDWSFTPKKAKIAMNQPVENDAVSQNDELEAEATATAFDGGGSEEEGEDVSAEFQQEVGKLEQAIWHAPQGKGTRIVAMIILVGIALALITMVVLVIVSLI